MRQVDAQSAKTEEELDECEDEAGFECLYGRARAVA